MKLSIIVPVYNVEQHLTRCVESIAMQMCDDYELILVDDGSTDYSGMLCDDILHQHPEQNITVIHQPNGGLSAARNRGIEAARGTYITFVDSDDCIDPLTLTDNMRYLLAHPEVDMLEYPIEVHAGSNAAHLLTFDQKTITTDIFTDWIRREGYQHCYACNKIYHRRLWQTVRFPLDIPFEDSAIMPTLIGQCQCIHYSDRGCYRYIMHNGTITTSYRYAKQRQLFLNNHRLYASIKDNPQLKREALQLWTCCLNQLIDMGRCADADHADHQYWIDETRQHRPSSWHLLRHALSSARNLKLLPLPFFGTATYVRCYIALTRTL